MFVTGRECHRARSPLKSIPSRYLWMTNLCTSECKYRLMNLRSRATGPFVPSKPTSACYRLLFKINALHATGHSNFLHPPPPPWEANREIVSPISRRSLTPRFRDNLIEGEASSSTTLDNNIDDQPSQQKSVGEACSIFVASILLLLFACPVSFIIIYLIGKVNKRGGWWYRDF